MGKTRNFEGVDYLSVEAKVILELKTDIKNLRAVNSDLRDGWDKTLEENLQRRFDCRTCDSDTWDSRKSSSSSLSFQFHVLSLRTK